MRRKKTRRRKLVAVRLDDSIEIRIDDSVEGQPRSNFFRDYQRKEVIYVWRDIRLGGPAQQ
jgi:hypothetical protein